MDFSESLKFYFARICRSCTCGLPNWLVSGIVRFGASYPLVITHRTINSLAWMADSCELPCIPCRYLCREVSTCSWIDVGMVIEVSTCSWIDVGMVIEVCSGWWWKVGSPKVPDMTTKTAMPVQMLYSL